MLPDSTHPFNGETPLLAMMRDVRGNGGFTGLLVWQVVTLDINDPENCIDRFRQAHIFGIFVFATLVGLWFAQSL